MKGAGRKGGVGGEGEGAQRREKENFISVLSNSLHSILTAVTPLHVHTNSIIVMHWYISFPCLRLEHIGLIPRL